MKRSLIGLLIPMVLCGCSTPLVSVTSQVDQSIKQQDVAKDINVVCNVDVVGGKVDTYIYNKNDTAIIVDRLDLYIGLSTGDRDAYKSEQTDYYQNPSKFYDINITTLDQWNPPQVNSSRKLTVQGGSAGVVVHRIIFKETINPGTIKMFSVKEGADNAWPVIVINGAEYKNNCQ